MLGLVLMMGIVAAHGAGYKEKFSETRYFSDDLKIVSKTTWVSYGNDDRYSTYDYRHGYSYRTTKEYFVDKYDDKEVISYGKKHGRWDGYDSGARTRYEYVPHMRSYEKRDCYVHPPADKLFYIRC